MMQATTQKAYDAKHWVLFFVILNALDIALTIGILQAGGQELNPLMRMMFEMGIPATVALKMGISAAFALLLYRLRRQGALKLATFMILAVCLFNTVGITVGMPGA
jgi:hypothetical protein